MLLGFGAELAREQELPTAAFQVWPVGTLWQAAGLGMLIYFYYMEALLHHIRLPIKEKYFLFFLHWSSFDFAARPSGEVSCMESVYFQSSLETSLSYTGVTPLHLTQLLVIYPPWERCVSGALLSLCCFPNNEPNKCFKAEAVAICSSRMPIAFLQQCPWVLLFFVSFYFFFFSEQPQIFPNP